MTRRRVLSDEQCAALAEWAASRARASTGDHHEAGTGAAGRYWRGGKRGAR